jgi:uncharacterized protein YbjT (DUF2867 family)
MTLVLATGATGTVGRAVVRELREREVAVRAFVRDPTRATAVLGEDAELAIGDLEEPESIRRALDGVDRLFLACGNVPARSAARRTRSTPQPPRECGTS